MPVRSKKEKTIDGGIPTFHKRRGFIFIELLIVIFIFTTIIILPSIFFWAIGQTDRLDSQIREIVNALNEAQINTISGKSQASQETFSYGVHFETNYYDLFNGTSYNAADPNNLRNYLPSGFTFSQIQLAGGNVIFEKVTGQVLNFDPNLNYVELLENNSQSKKRIFISRFGGITYE